MFKEDSSYSGDSYTKYALNPANKHDDSKLQDKYKTNGSSPQQAALPIGGAVAKNDPYRFTRSTLQKQQSAPNASDKARMADLTSKYKLVQGIMTSRYSWVCLTLSLFSLCGSSLVVEFECIS